VDNLDLVTLINITAFGYTFNSLSQKIINPKRCFLIMYRAHNYFIAVNLHYLYFRALVNELSLG
jgi:hypothetical protein